MLFHVQIPTVLDSVLNGLNHVIIFPTPSSSVAPDAWGVMYMRTVCQSRTQTRYLKSSYRLIPTCVFGSRLTRPANGLSSSPIASYFPIPLVLPLQWKWSRGSGHLPSLVAQCRRWLLTWRRHPQSWRCCEDGRWQLLGEGWELWWWPSVWILPLGRADTQAHRSS